MKTNIANESKLTDPGQNQATKPDGEHGRGSVQRLVRPEDDIDISQYKPVSTGYHDIESKTLTFSSFGQTLKLSFDDVEPFLVGLCHVAMVDQLIQRDRLLELLELPYWGESPNSSASSVGEPNETSRPL